MSAYGTKRTSIPALNISAIGGEAEFLMRALASAKDFCIPSGSIRGSNISLSTTEF